MRPIRHSGVAALGLVLALAVSGAQAQSYDARASQMIGKTVTNAMDQKIGTVDDLLIARDGRVDRIVLSVGGFLGIGDKLVAVPYAQIGKKGDALIFDRSADQLKAQPEFKYSVASNAAPGSRDEYLRTTGQRMNEWDKRVADWKKSAKNASSDAGKKLDSAWATTKAKFADMKNATAEGWDRAKTSFDKAWNDLQNAWTDATS
jgi:sporulation protein YlmC with PRC-barrel domain